MKIVTKLSEDQAKFLQRDNDPLVIFQAGVGSGKTYVCAIWIITQLLKNHNIVAAAQSHSALRKVLFRQVKVLLNKWKIRYKENKNDHTITVGKAILYGYSNEAPDDVLGLSDIFAVVIDEAARCCEDLYNNLCDRCRGEGVDEPFKRLITSPLSDEPSARWFNDLCDAHPESVIEASLLNNPFVSKKYKKELTERYGIGTPLYNQQVLGKRIETDYLNAIVKSSDFSDGSRFSPLSTPLYYGMDVASAGRDSTELFIINSTGIVGNTSQAISDTHTHTSMVVDMYDTYNGIRSGCIDNSGGFGQGCYDNVKHIAKITMVPINFSESPTKDIYKNIRAEMYLEMAQAIKNGFYIDQVKYPELVEELRNTKFFIDEKGKLRIIPKEDIKRAIGRSPDRADALALAIYAMNHHDNVNIKAVVTAALRLMGH